MNYLAHAFLSGDNQDVLFGNFITDCLDGKKTNIYSGLIREGILFHHEIDRFTDLNATVDKGIVLLQPVFRKYSAVVIDIYYDHFLAAKWNDYSQIDLVEYTQKVYKIMIKRYLILPPKAKRIIPWMIAQNWLSSYANLTDLQRTFNGMARRTSNISRMDDAVLFLKENYDFFEMNFQEFFPELIHFCQEYRKSHLLDK